MSFRNIEIDLALVMTHHDAVLQICRQGFKENRKIFLVVKFYADEVERPVKCLLADPCLAYDAIKTLFKNRHLIKDSTWNALMGFMDGYKQAENEEFLNDLDMGYRRIYDVLPKYNYLKEQREKLNAIVRASNEELKLPTAASLKKEEPKDDYEF